MKRVGVRQFKTNLSKLINNPPLIITNHNKPIAVVISYNDVLVALIDHGEEKKNV